MRTITPDTYIVYKFDELPEEVQAKVLEREWDWNVAWLDWWDVSLDFWVEKLAAYGFINAKVYFSGFSSQGDGACFDADVDLNVLTNHMFYEATTYKEARDWRAINLAVDRGLIYDASIYTTNHHYSHENCRRLTVNYLLLQDCQTTERFSNMLDDLDELRRDLCQEIYSSLRQEYDYLTSEEAIKESLIANEYEFNIEGDME